MRFNFLPTGIGSLPYSDPKVACGFIREQFHDMPFWPQLPKRTFLENMYVQYAEGLPGAVIDESAKTIHIDSSKAIDGIEEAYAKYLENDLEYFKISETRAEGFYAFLDTLKSSPPASYVKGGVTGPVSFGLSVTDENKQSIIYHKDMFEVLTKILVMKARWQISKLKEYCQNPVIFIDEPYLISIGSSYINVSVEDAVSRLEELSGAIKDSGGISGIHCCGNTDWSMLLKLNIDILSFDAYSGAREFSLYSDEIKAFVAKGSTIAWGIIPSSDATDKETASSLRERFDQAVGMLSQKGIPKDSISSLITPSCGLGSLDEFRAKRILQATKEVSESLRR